MEQIRTYGKANCPNLFDPNDAEQPPLKIGTEVFDSTMPSELQFEDEEPAHHNSKGEFSLFENGGQQKKKEVLVSGEVAGKQQQCESQSDVSQYDMLTKSIVTFTFHKTKVIFANPEYAIGSYIPHFLGIKTFPAKFKDQDSQISKGISKFQLLWKSVVGYVKIQLFITANTIYLLERRKQGLLVKQTWNMANLFKVFSDREQGKARMIFRVAEQGEARLLTKQFEEVDLNLLATLLAETSDSFKITSE